MNVMHKDTSALNKRLRELCAQRNLHSCSGIRRNYRIKIYMKRENPIIKDIIKVTFQNININLTQ